MSSDGIQDLWNQPFFIFRLGGIIVITYLLPIKKNSNNLFVFPPEFFLFSFPFFIVSELCEINISL